MTEALKAHRKACLQAIIDAHGGEDIEYVRRCAYKYTDCGAWVSVLTAAGWIHSGTKVPEGVEILGLLVGSIVEGVDQGTSDYPVIFDGCETPKHAVERYDRALNEVDDEADFIWDSTHGCPTCALHWLQEGIYEDEKTRIDDWKGDDDERWQVGATPVWDECPDCGGSGATI
jgi:hypothetical protein